MVPQLTTLGISYLSEVLEITTVIGDADSFFLDKQEMFEDQHDNRKMSSCSSFQGEINSRVHQLLSQNAKSVSVVEYSFE